MRVSDRMLTDMLAANISTSKTSIYDIQKQISSGKKVSVASDSPGDYELLFRLQNSYSIDEQKLKNSDSLQLELYGVDTTLDNITQLLHRASELVTTASDGTKPPGDRQSMAEEIDLILNQMVDAANAKPMGKYVFAGLRTDVPPYVVTRDADGRIDSVTYQGNTDIREVEVGKYIPSSGANKIEANIPGSDLPLADGTYDGSTKAVFQTSEGDIFQTLIRIRDQLLTGRNPVEEEEFTADPATDILTVNREYQTGAMVTVSSDGDMPGISGGGNLVNGGTYYAIRVSDTEIQLAANFRDAVQGNAIDLDSAGTGVQKITTSFSGELNAALDQTLNLRSDVGSRLQHLEQNQSIMWERQLSMAETIDKRQAVDVAQAIIELVQAQTAYEAALRIISSTLKSSVIDYI